MSVPRPEHPRPQFFREDWLNLNGTWTFEFDFGNSGLQRDWQNSRGFSKEILVPFCPESELSGVAYKDFMHAVWYQREITIPEEWDGNRVLIHFGAVDFESEVFIDGCSVGKHWGGTSSFEYDITRFVKAGGTHRIVVYALDELPGNSQPAGKQSGNYKSAGCHYTRTTGIWQTVWLESVPEHGLKRCRIVPDLDGKRFVITPEFYAEKCGLVFRAICRGEDESITAEAPAGSACGVEIKLDNPRLWSPSDPVLYDFEFQVVDASGEVVDSVESYAGLRKIHIEGNQLFLNNKPLYQRLVLDQGFYQEGIWTAPDDEALKNDIELSMQAGFNGARLHQKVFEERFHYWADRLGYLTWAESSSWGLLFNKWDYPKTSQGFYSFIAEWKDIVMRDINHPSIITWTPLNETHNKFNDSSHYRFHQDLYDLTKSLDSTRPVNDTSGYIHVKTDLWTVHNYGNAEKLNALLNGSEEEVYRCKPEQEVDYTGQPYIVSEFGGIKWVPETKGNYADNSWGYGEDPQSMEEFFDRLEKTVDAVLKTPYVTGYCYTQLTDVEQEENGVYNYDRSCKFDPERIYHIFGRDPQEKKDNG